MRTRPADSPFESAFDVFWQTPTLLAKLQMEVVVASMTVGIGFWCLWHTSRGERAIQSIDKSSFGDRSVIHAKFRR